MIKAREKERRLLQLWLEFKCWNSCCIDEAIDWSNLLNSGRYNLTEGQMAEYIQWKNKFLELVDTLKNHVGPIILSNLHLTDFIY